MFWEGVLAEREGFEPPVPLRVRLISSQVHSTGLCHLSACSLITVKQQDAISPRLVYREMSYGCNTGEVKAENGVRQNEMGSTHTNPANLRTAKRS